MTAKQKLFALAASMGIIVDDNSTSDAFDHTLVAPNGMTFDATGTHILCTHQNKGFGAAAVAEYWQAMHSDIDYGLIAGLIAVVIITVVGLVGTDVTAAFQSIADAL